MRTIKQWNLYGCAVIVLVGSLGSANRVEAEELAEIQQLYTEHDRTEREAGQFAFVRSQDASAPIGRFLLIRKGKDLCAIRFAQVHHNRDAEPLGLIYGSSESLYARYDWYYQPDGSGDFASPAVESGQGESSDRLLIFTIAHYALQLGDPHVRCGLFNLAWKYPNSVSVYHYGQKGDYWNIEFAPTKWEDVRQINVHDPLLIWYSYDLGTKRNVLRISLEDLPGSSMAQ